MKKLIAALLLVCMLASLFAGCGGKTPADAGKDGKLSIVCTIFPVYDWVRAILGDRVQDTDLEMLLDSGVDLHSYEPLPDDLLLLAQCDLFIYVGGESDEKWAPGTIETNNIKNTLNLLEALGDAAKEEEDVPGMQEHEHEHEEDHDHEEEHELDEHIWLSLKNAALLCGVIRDRLCALDPDHADVYKKNADAYVAQLNALDAEYAAAVAGAKNKALLVADRFPFRYLCEDYGITPYAAFSGCSTESNASMATIAGLAGYLDRLGLTAVAVTETSDKGIARSVIESSQAKNQTVVELDSLQSVTAEKRDQGITYLDVMRKNLTALKTALN